MMIMTGTGWGGESGEGGEVGKGGKLVEAELLNREECWGQSGPVEGMFAFTVANKEYLEWRLEEPLGKKGTIEFWVKLSDDGRPKSGRVLEQLLILMAEGGFRVDLRMRPNQTELVWNWDKSIEGALSLRPVVAGLPGPGWMHVLYTWDAELGYFDGYFNGVSLREPGTKVPVWNMSGAFDVVKSPAKGLRMAGVASCPEFLPQEEVRKRVPESYLDRGGKWLGAVELPAFDAEGKKRELIYENSFTEASTKNWVKEGPMVLEFSEKGVQMASELAEYRDRGQVVWWCDEEFPRNFIAEWEYQPISERGLCIVFFAASGLQGESIFSPELASREDGAFPKYHSGDINCYHISYYANTPETPGRLTSNLRKNKGFYLVASGPPGIPAESHEWHKLTLMKSGNQIRFAVDGRTIIDFTDDGATFGRVLGSGKIGFRQMQWSVGNYRNFRVYACEDY